MGSYGLLLWLNDNNKRNGGRREKRSQFQYSNILKNGPTRPLFRLFLVFSNKQYNFYNKSMLKTSIQYTAPRWLVFVFQDCRVIVTYKLRFKDFFWEQTTNECKKTFSDSNEAKIWTFEHLFPQISDPFLTLITSRHDDASNVTTWWR